MSYFEIILRSGPIALLTFATLGGFSIYSWAVIIFKARKFMDMRAESKQFWDAFNHQSHIEHLKRRSAKYPTTPLFRLFNAGLAALSKEVKAHKFTPVAGSVLYGASPELEKALKRAYSKERARLGEKLSFLATVGSSAPFIGLFGTVMGIMDSFRRIGETGSASLATVAPGIAEALVATAAGLLAAIPAVIAYNYFLTQMKSSSEDMQNFCEEFALRAKDFSKDM